MSPGRGDVPVGFSGAWRRGQPAEKMTMAMRELRMRPFYAWKLSIQRDVAVRTLADASVDYSRAVTPPLLGQVRFGLGRPEGLISRVKPRM
jgi:hypothetical protein